MKIFALLICLALLTAQKLYSQDPADVPQPNEAVTPEAPAENNPPAVAPNVPADTPTDTPADVSAGVPTGEPAPPAADAQGAPPSPSQPGVTPPPSGTATNPLPPEMIDPLLEGFFEDVNYNPTDRRDPFLPYLSVQQKLVQGPEVVLEPLQKFALSELKLIGIIWDVGQPKALIQDPAGKSHIIIENTKLGQEMGYVAAIREGEVIVVEQQTGTDGRKSFQTKVLKLVSAQGT